jgi:hypothetical protein
MTGDRHKSMNTFCRWVEAFADGLYWNSFKGKHKRRVPSLVEDKRYERRRRRHEAKMEFINEYI